MDKIDDIMMVALNERSVYDMLVWLKNAITKKVKRGLEFNYETLVDSSVMRRIQQGIIRNYNKSNRTYGYPAVSFTNEEKREIRKRLADEIVEWMDYDKNNGLNENTMSKKNLREWSFTDWGYMPDIEDWPLVNTEEDGDRLFKVSIWSGRGYILDCFRVWSDTDDVMSIIEKVVAYLDKEGDTSLFVDDAVEREMKELEDEGYDDEKIEEEIDEWACYVNATREGASEPHWIPLENLGCEEFPKEYMERGRQTSVDESRLRRIVRESVRRVLRENNEDWENRYLPTNMCYWQKKHPEWSEEQCKKAVDTAFRSGKYGNRNSGEKDPDKLMWRRNTKAHWKARHPEWSDEKCSAAAKRFSDYEKRRK